jgi:cysteine synthase A
VDRSRQAALVEAGALAEDEGVFCGVSGGANVEGAIRLAGERPELDEIVTIIPDTGHRYFTTKLFEDDHELEVPDRDHPLDDHSRAVLEQYQDDWHIID